MDRLRYNTLRIGIAVFERLRLRLTPAGWLILGFWLVAGAMGIDPTQSTAYQAFGLLTGIWLVSLCSLFFFQPRLQVSRRLPRFASAGEPLRYRWSIVNEGPELADVILRDSVEHRVPSYELFCAANGYRDESRTFVERFFGYGRWRALIRRTAARTEFAEVPFAKTGARVEAYGKITPACRGRLELKGALATRVGPLGLMRSLVMIPVPDRVLVLPKRYPVGRLDMPGSARFQPGGVALASRIGESPEFAGLREYRPGDPLRRIDWKSWAKEGRPIVREYHDEQFVRHALVLDTFVPAAREDLFEEAVSVASSFAQSLLTQESLLDLLFVVDQAYCVTAGRGLGTSEQMLEVLAGVQRCEDQDIATLEASVARRRDVLTGCIFILTAYDEARRSLVASLEAVGVPTRTFVICEPGEGDPAAWGPSVRRLEMGRIAEGLAS
ncbi:MAG: DUF58 domain-containing protein [Elusimicrobia bacterium]|nr:MAG: DUF58 domain-containing protein [Elusimicrobiota bacterium]